MIRAMTRTMSAGVAALALAFAGSSAHALTSHATLSNADVSVEITMDDSAAGAGNILVTLVATPDSDLRGFFFDISDTSLLSGLTASSPSYTPLIVDFSGNVSSVGNPSNNMNPDSFHAGIEIGTPGASPDFYPSFQIVLSHASESLSLDLFTDQRLGVRVMSIGQGEASAKLTGRGGDPIPEPFTAMLTIISAGAVSLAVSRRRAT